METCSLRPTLLSTLAILSLELIVGAQGHVLSSYYGDAGCKGKPVMVIADSLAAIASHLGGGQCVPVPPQPGLPGELHMKFRSEDDGAKCFVDVFAGKNCEGQKQTQALYTGECTSVQEMQGGMRRLAARGPRGGDGPGFVKTECIAQVPEKLDWDATCITKEMAEKAKEEYAKMTKNIDSVCFKGCLLDPEAKFVSSKEAFDGAFEKGGCAEGCDDEQKEVARTAAINLRKFDCNYKTSAEVFGSGTVTV